MATQTVVRIGNTVNRVQITVEDLIRSLVNTADALDGTTSATTSVAAEEILIDMDVDGARYLLVRMPLPERQQVQLSPREQEIVRMVAQGHPNKVIAEVLSISTWTVCTHLRRIFAKAGVGSRATMVARFYENRPGNKERRAVSSVSGCPGTENNAASNRP